MRNLTIVDASWFSEAAITPQSGPPEPGPWKVRSLSSETSLTPSELCNAPHQDLHKHQLSITFPACLHWSHLTSSYHSRRKVDTTQVWTGTWTLLCDWESDTVMALPESWQRFLWTGSCDCLGCARDWAWSPSRVILISHQGDQMFRYCSENVDA